MRGRPDGNNADLILDKCRKTQHRSLVVMKTRSFLKSSLSNCALLGALFVPSGSSDAGDPPKKVVLCHKGNTIEVAEPAVDAHLKHGDTLGACQVSPGQNR